MRDFTTYSREHQGSVEDRESTFSRPSIIADSEEIKRAIQVLRNDSSTGSFKALRHQPTITYSSDSEARNTSYSEQRSRILESFMGKTSSRRSARSSSVGSKPPSLNVTKPSRPRPMVQRSTLSTPEVPDIVLDRLRKRIYAHLDDINCPLADLFHSESLSLIEIYEILTYLNVPDVSESELDQLLLHLSVDTYWEDGYFHDVPRKQLLEFFS